MTTLERLEQQLDLKDARIDELETELQELKDEAASEWKWARHKKLKDNPDNLPVPRLEIRWHNESDDGYLTRWDYTLIYRHLLGHLIAVPLSQTRITGGNGSPPIHNGRIQTPFRDGVHICHDTHHLGIPAFGIVGDKIVRLTMKDEKCEQEEYIPEQKDL